MNPKFVSAVEMLPMPRATRLGSKRLAGTCCVWCGALPEMALGPRLSVIAGALTRWEPRSCRPCAGREAARVYGIHVRVCARCSHRDYCPDSRALYGLAVECRQSA